MYGMCISINFVEISRAHPLVAYKIIFANCMIILFMYQEK